MQLTPITDTATWIRSQSNLAIKPSGVTYQTDFSFSWYQENILLWQLLFPRVIYCFAYNIGLYPL